MRMRAALSRRMRSRARGPLLRELPMLRGCPPYRTARQRVLGAREVRLGRSAIALDSSSFLLCACRRDCACNVSLTPDKLYIQTHL